jgi:hypothetical protein
MTANRDLKRRVRDRQAETGESYMTALQRVLAQRETSSSTAIQTVEFIDASDLAEVAGLRCQVALSPPVAHGVDVAQTLAAFRQMLVATQHDPLLRLMRSVALGGESAPFELTAASVQEGAAFVRRLRAGLGGVSDSGRMLALRAVPRAASGKPVPLPADSIVLFSLRLTPTFVPVTRPPLLIVTSIDETVNDPLTDLIKEMRARRVVL